MVAGSESSLTQTRASRLIAEALVERHGRSVIVERARSMGLPRGLTDAVVTACGCQQTSDASHHRPTADRNCESDTYDS